MRRIQGRRRSIELGLERCEDRFLLTTYSVQNTSGLIGTANSLPWAINQANLDTGNPGVDTIDFNIPGSGPFAISVTTALPTIMRPVLIDGTSQPGYHPADVPVVSVGEQTGSGTLDGFVLGAGSGGSTVQGLSIVDFGGAGIHVESAGDTIASDYLGVTTTGTGAGNQYGVLVDDVGGTTIGGTTAAADMIGANTSAGVSISGAAATGNLVASDFIGVNSQGTSLPNSTGVVIAGSASNNTIGGTHDRRRQHDRLEQRQTAWTSIPGMATRSAATSSTGIPSRTSTSPTRPTTAYMLPPGWPTPRSPI